MGLEVFWKDRTCEEKKNNVVCSLDQGCGHRGCFLKKLFLILAET